MSIRPINQLVERFALGETSVFDAIVEDDRDYFRAASHQMVVEGWRVLLPGRSLPPSNTCLVEPAPGQSQCPVQVAAFCQDHGFETIRFYLPGPADTHQSWPALFQRAEEVAMCGGLSQLRFTGPANGLTVRTAGPGDDRFKMRWLETDANRPDGKAMAAHDYIATDNAKADDGYMENYLILEGDMPIGSFGISLGQPDLVRMKNLLLAKEYRGRGFGSAAISFAARQAQSLSRPWIGAFALSPGPALSLYESHGMKAVGIQTEMIAPLANVAKGGS
ncbi:MAG: GNAT family N-acetyltransferase [Pseudomonadota bacterium]